MKLKSEFIKATMQRLRERTGDSYFYVNHPDSGFATGCQMCGCDTKMVQAIIEETVREILEYTDEVQDLLVPGGAQ